MAKRVTEKDIYEINCAYIRCGTYSGAAKETGWSASTVKKYIIKDFKPIIEEKKTFLLSDFSPSKISNIEPFFKELTLSDEEEEEIKELWNELTF